MRIVVAGAVALSLSRSAIVIAQTKGHDLPIGFRAIAGVTLNRDSAASIRAKLGRTRERKVGEGHDVYASWCYVPGGPTSSSLLELMSDISDMGTEGRALNVIRLRETAPADDREGCARLPATKPMSTSAGLQLGISERKIVRLLGQPKRRSVDSLIYEIDAKEYMRPGTRAYRYWNKQRQSCFEGGPPYSSVGGVVIVLLRDDRAVEIRLERYDQATC